jgi:hypothetical protein
MGRVVEIPQVGGLHHLHVQSCLIEAGFQTLRENADRMASTSHLQEIGFFSSSNLATRLAFPFQPWRLL